MPWTRKQQDMARAVKHGFKPTGKAKGFDRDFAEQVLDESDMDEHMKRKKKAEMMLGKGAHAGTKR